ncbi:MAG: hypothetical protein R3A45_01840 [Bdellovibrionota bacterium]
MLGRDHFLGAYAAWFFCIACFTPVWAQSALPLDASFRAIILKHTNVSWTGEKTVTPPAQRLYKDLGKACYDALHSFYADKKSFGPTSMPETHAFMQRTVQPLERYFQTSPFGSTMNYHATSGSPYNNIFYHYFSLHDDGLFPTEIQNMATIMQSHGFTFDSQARAQDENAKQSFEQILWESRTNATSFGATVGYNAQNHYGVLYAAYGPFSSSQYGDTLLSIEFKQGATIIDLSKPLLASQLLHSIGSDLISHHQKLSQHCQNKYLVLPVLEDFGIDLIHYAIHSDWFKILRSDQIQALLMQDMSDANAIEKLPAMGRGEEVNLHFNPDTPYQFRSFYHFQCKE